jgi:hypothetical protein
MLYLVAYRYDRGGDPDRVGAVVRDLSANSWKACDNVWVVESDEPATALRDRIRHELAENEAVIVALLAGHAAWHGFERDSLDWLLAHL